MRASDAVSYALLAELILVLHAGVVAFVVIGELLFLVGGWRGWRWVRNFGLRLTHLLLMLFIAVQTWLGAWCPLTVWEQRLRAAAGQPSYQEGFIEHWVSRAIFFELSWWAFAAGYSAFFVLVVATWWWVPPRRGRAAPGAPAGAARAVTKSRPPGA